VCSFVSRAGRKLEHALLKFGIDVNGLACADLGSNVGGFVDCLLQRRAARVYAIDTGYGVLAWKLRRDDRVIVMERTNAMHTAIPQPVDLVTIDVAWTRQRHILPAARRMLGPGGIVISLIKPHYEADARMLRGGVLPPEHLDNVLATVRSDIQQAGFRIIEMVHSPIRGAKGNVELLAHLVVAPPTSAEPASG
jgi:23S rRNA (cytidine1920-2'-O)/16S rRNA (cytidine1409-2'-O)-methyltransferase